MRKCLRTDAIPTLNKGDEVNERLCTSKCSPSVPSKRDMKTDTAIQSHQKIHEEEIVTTTIETNNTEYDQGNYFHENDCLITTHDGNYDTLEQESDLERFVESLCRLCAGSFVQNQLVGYSSFLNLIIKCFPTLNLENYEYFPKQICTECREKLISLSIFIDKTMTAQNYLTDKLVHNLPNISESFIDNRKIIPRIKQEPVVVIKEEKIDKKIEFCAKVKGTLHALKDKITFKDSKHCEIIKIVNLNTPLIDLRNHRPPPSPQKRQTDLQPFTNHGQISYKRVSTPQNNTLDDDIEILSPTPLKVEEIIEGDEAEEHRIQQQVPVKIDHNYSRSPFTGKIEILEERVFKTEVSDVPFINPLTSNIEEPNHELNDLCTICNFIFDSSSALKHHNFENHPEFKSNIVLKNENLRVCTLCNMGFGSVYQYLQHKQVVHAKKKISLKCRNCRKFFVTKDTFSTHIRYKCNAFSRKHRKYKRHDERFELKKILEEDSILNLGSSSNMRQLIEEASKKEYLYIDGPLEEETTESKPSTSETHSKKTCSKCGRAFLKHNLMIAHEAKHRPLEQWDNACRICSKLFDHLSDLHWHVRYTCIGVKDLKVTIPTFSHTYYSCSMCGTSVSSLWSLKNHENIHTRKVMFKCKLLDCQKSFVSKQNLAQHSLTHKDERNYRCHLCEKSFKRANGLTQHINGFHLSVRPHVCHICNKSYSLKTDMTRCKHSFLKYNKK